MHTLGPTLRAGAIPTFIAHALSKAPHFISIAIACTIAAWSAPQAEAAPAGSAASNPFELAAAPPPQGRIDELVFARLAQLGVAPAHVCSDAVFVHRVFLDVIGTLPTAAEAKQFLDDQSPDKRAALIDRLFARDEFADYWAMKWGDLLRVKAEFPVNLWPNAAQAYHHWIHASLRADLPYDQFARELLTANGSNFRVGPVNFYRAIQNKDATTIARTVALTFMGTRAEKWPAERLAGLSAFFASLSYKSTGEWKEEIVFFDPNKALTAGAPVTVLPDGTAVQLAPDRDPREVFAHWLTTDQNPWFATAMANRVWSWLLGRGIVHEADDLRPDNPPANPALLAYLTRQFVAGRYAVKPLMREILTSTTYQLSSLARSDRPEAEANFAFYAPRRLDAEVLIDALNQITGTTEKYSSAIPEPFTFVPEGLHAIALPDGSITSTFLETFGRPSRDTGLEAERNNRITATQRLTLLNSTQIQRKLEQGPALQTLFRTARPGSWEVVDGLYYAILSRPPTSGERTTVGAYVQAAGKDKRAAAIDLAWALINSPEFLYRQ
jgi:hypothetical protein